MRTMSVLERRRLLQGKAQLTCEMYRFEDRGSAAQAILPVYVSCAASAGVLASCWTVERKKRKEAHLCEACFVAVCGVDRAHESRGLFRADKLDEACRGAGGRVR